MLNIAGGVLLIVTFGWAVGATRRRWGSNPIVIASLWLALELALIELKLTPGVFKSILAASDTARQIGAVFGFLAVSFLIVLLNSAILLTARLPFGIRCHQRRAGSRRLVRTWTYRPGVVLFSASALLLPLRRGPPQSLTADS